MALWPYFLFLGVRDSLVEFTRVRRLQRAQRDEKYRRYLALEDAKKAAREDAFLEKKEREAELHLEAIREQRTKTRARIATPTYRIAERDEQDGGVDLPEEVAEKLRKAKP